MGLLRITPIVILILQLFGVQGDQLPVLPGNKLAIGSDTELPNASVIDCIQGHQQILAVFTPSQTLKPSDALSKTNFENYPFYSQSFEAKLLKNGGVGKFSFAKMEYKHGLLGKTRTAFGLQVSDGRIGESAYWLPQGGTIDIPKTPNADQPHYVFTPDFSGCSWTVTPLGNGNLRLRHVQGGDVNVEREFNSKNPAEIGGATTYAMQYKNYGYIKENGRPVGNVPAYAYMHFSNGKWSIHVQQQTCSPRSGTCTYNKNKQVTGMKMNFFEQIKYNMITGTKVFSIP